MRQSFVTLPKKVGYQLYDIQGLSVNITTTGTKSFKFRVMKKGKRCNLTLGQYPLLILIKTRQLAEDKRFLYKNDLIHVANEAEVLASKALLLSEFVEHWKLCKFVKLYGDEALAITAKRQSTCKQIDRALRNDINPVIGDLPLDLITKKQNLQIQQNIES